MGVSGVGKTTFGRLLASRLCAAFIDADDHHSAENKRLMAAGKPLTDAHRLPWLRSIAAEAVALRASGARTIVIACSALKRRYRDVLAHDIGSPVFIHLDAEAELIGRRLAARKGHFMPPSLLASQMATLEPLGEDENGFRIDAALPPEAMADKAMARLRLADT